jgi:hypothetical protein
MNRRGRPRKNGVQPGWMFYRTMIAFYRYNEARIAGPKHKHCDAIGEAVSAVQHDLPGIPISKTEVRRAVAQLQPKGAPSAYVVTKLSNAPYPAPQLPPSVCLKWGLPTNTKMVHCFAFGIGKHPDHPRINARPAKKTTSRKK